MIRIGKIVNCHGIKGELTILPLTDAPGRFRKLKTAYLELQNGTHQEIALLTSREHKGNVLLQIEGIEDRTQAERYKNCYICVKEEDAVKPKGAFFIHELIGLTVYEGDICYGELTDVIQNGGMNDIYEVKGDKGDIYLPALKSVVKEINLDTKRMEIIMPDGLLD